MDRWLAGGIAGLVATVPMTLAMHAIRRRTPPETRYPFAPDEVTERMEQRVGVEGELGPEGHAAAVYGSHFGYGAAMGGVYGALEHNISGPPMVKGIAWGLGVWAAGYMGWLPASGLMPFPTERPAAWNARLIAAHIVWGATLGAVENALSS